MTRSGSPLPPPPARLPRIAAALALVLSGALLWLGPTGMDAVRSLEAQWRGHPEEAGICSFRLRTGLPCVGCGGTRALALMGQGRWRDSWRANPLGAYVGFGAWTVMLAAAHGLLGGRRRCLTWAFGLFVATLPIALLVSAVFWWSSLPSSTRLTAFAG
jgi:Protein of unknown function (DUF2752)